MRGRRTSNLTVTRAYYLLWGLTSGEVATVLVRSTVEGLTAGPSRNASRRAHAPHPTPAPEAAERRPEPAGRACGGGGRRFYVFEKDILTFLVRTRASRGPGGPRRTARRPRSRNPTQSAQCPTSSSTQSAHQDTAADACSNRRCLSPLCRTAGTDYICIPSRHTHLSVCNHL